MTGDVQREDGPPTDGEANTPKRDPNPTNGVSHEFDCTHDPCRCATTDTFTDAQGRRYIAGQQVPEEVWLRHEKVLEHETYLMAEVMRRDAQHGRATVGCGTGAGEGVEGRGAEPRVPSSLAAATGRRVADTVRGRRSGGETRLVALHNLHAHWDESGHGTFPDGSCGTCTALTDAYWSSVGPMPWEHLCDVAGCERGFATMAEVVAHERTHAPRFARLRDRILGRSKSDVSGRQLQEREQ